MKLFLIFVLVTGISYPVKVQEVKEKIIVYYVPWKAKFGGALNERIIKEMNNSAIRRDTIISDSVISQIKYQLTKLELLDTIYGDLDLRMVCVLLKKDNSQQMFSFGYARMQIKMYSKVYSSNPILLSLIEKNIKPHSLNQ